jgi:malonyl-CoA O-methyltransferase
VVQRLQRFLAELPQHDAQPPSQLQKQRVAASFSRAAASYDAVADLQRAVGDSLLSRIPAGPHATVVDLGCGTGYFQRPLAAMTHCETLLGVDIAQGMLQYARQHHAAAVSCWLAGDAEQLPLADNCVDLIFSSLAIQWCENLPALFSEVARVLRPGGRFVFATLGPNTLNELRQAWQQVDSHVHVNRFLPRSALLQAAPNLVLSEQVITLQYQKLNELTRELKGLGAHNVNAGRPTGLTGKQRIIGLKQAYEAFRNGEGQLPATYQVWFGEYCKQEPS